MLNLLQRCGSRARFLGPLVALLVLCSQCGGGTDGRTGGAPVTEPPAAPSSPVAPAPELVMSADSVALSAILGETRSTTVQVTAANAAPLVNISVGTPVYSGAGDWLSVSVNASTAPATISIIADASRLAAGEYAAAVPVSATGAASRAVRVRLVVHPRPELKLQPPAIAISATLGDSAQHASIQITASGGDVGSLALGTVDCGASPSRWLSVSLSGDAAPAVVLLRADPAGLAVGEYACRLPIATTQPLVDGAAQILTVTLHVHAAPAIGFSPSQLAVSMAPGTATWGVDVVNGGSGTLDHLAIGAVSYGSSASGWITSVELTSATAPASIRARIDATHLAPGSYDASITVLSSADGIVDSPRILPVKLTVISSAGAPSSPPPPVNGGPLHLIVTPAALSGSCHLGQQLVPLGTVHWAMSDGSPATVAGVDQSFTGPPNFVLFGPAFGDDKIPMTYDVEADCVATGTYVLTMVMRTTSGYSAAQTITLTVTP